jgi:outer membrane protein OmpA-like peptidoglycan-associated protein
MASSFYEIVKSKIHPLKLHNQIYRGDSTMKAQLLPSIAAGALMLVAGCSTPPQASLHLEEARRDLSAIQSDTLAVRYAPVALKEAEEALAKSEDLWQNKAPKVELEHQIYLAKQQIRIATESARIKVAEAEVERAGLDRKQVQLEAQQKQTEEAQRRAETARLRAQQAQQRIQDLAAQLRELEAKKTERGMVLTLKDVLFDSGKAELKPRGRDVMAKVADFLKEYGERQVLIEGHTDDVGTEAFNQTLSEQRAKAVDQVLIDLGIDSRRIHTRGYGELHPIAANSTNDGRQQNRRVEIVFSDESGTIPGLSRTQ